MIQESDSESAHDTSEKNEMGKLFDTFYKLLLHDDPLSHIDNKKGWRYQHGAVGK